MRNRALVVLALVAGSSLPAAAKVKAEILCGVFKNKKVDFTVPSELGPHKLTRTVTCSVEMKGSGKNLVAGIRTRGVGTAGPEHHEAISKDDDFEVDLVPGVDFQTCVDFRIEARITGDAGAVEWEEALEVPQGCAAAPGKTPVAATVTPAPAPATTPGKKPSGKPFKATLYCGQRLKGSSKAMDLSTEGAYRISAESIECDVQSADPRIQDLKLDMTPQWHKVDDHHVDKLHRGEAQHFEGPFPGEGKMAGVFQFTLARGTDWDECATDISIPVKLTDASGALVWQEERVYRQDCSPIPVAPPVGLHTAPASDQLPVGVAVAGQSVRFGENELAGLPDDGARTIAVSFAQMMIDGDAQVLSRLFPPTGLLVGKKKVRMGDDDIYKLTGIQRMYGCEKRGAPGCKWGAWRVQVTSPKEFSLYNTDDSFYGPYPAAVFKKSSAQWQWAAVKSLDMGEP